ncbi:hypothetical protein [Bizionia paragorgiae]|uniref:Uncharacterized protein n=1 Tax=Bizionia paragorgiae TaxID=283786 RepID=A0A1H3W2Z8_BIZPA|nr:hypothetical protein [Bizionia paragorgiae]SDZ80774.1 hypothetical protein SAMN04487990_102166 [Bizionia paragorgiae]
MIITPTFAHLLYVLTFSLISQNSIKTGLYISKNKLQYITIQNGSQFKYESYKNYSPYTVKEKQKKDSIQSFCNSVIYWTNIESNGKYYTKNDSIILEFDSVIKKENFPNTEFKTLGFLISELKKIK